MFKKILTFALMFCLCLFIVDATSTIEFRTPANDSMSSSSTITYGFNITGNYTTYQCTLNTTENLTVGPATSWIVHETILATNNTNTAFTNNINVKDTNGTGYNWTVRCIHFGGTDATTAGTMYYGVDTVAPVVTIHANVPINSEWLNVNTTAINLTVIETNADTCELFTTLNFTADTTLGGALRTYGLESSYEYSNNTIFNFSDQISFKDNNSGAYFWNYICNDTAGNEATIANQTFWIDTVSPLVITLNWSDTFTSPGAESLLNDSTSTDYTPELKWNQTTDLNFSRYAVRFYTNAGRTTLGVEKNITTISTLRTNMSTLGANTQYWIDIIAYDLAGNSVSMGNAGEVYTTSSICHTLNTGWNICAVLGNNKTLATILTDTGGTTVAYLNTSNEFETQVSGGSNGAVVVPSGKAFFTYLTTAGTWQDSIQNSSAYLDEQNLTNSTNTNWNIMVQLNTSTINFTNIDYQLNGGTVDTVDSNVTAFSLYNNSASSGSKYIPYVTNLTSLNGDTEIKYGDTIWMYLGINVTSLRMNWTLV